MYDDLLYPRGYLITDLDIKKGDLFSPLKNWDIINLNKHVILNHPDLSKNVKKGSKENIVILGKIFDPINHIGNEKKILNKIHKSISKSWDNFFQYLDCLSGRFILFLEQDDKAYAIPDATGTKQLFYDIKAKSVVLSSHIDIIAKMNDYSMSTQAVRFMKSPSYKDRGSYFPGIATPYSEIKILTPNTLLSLPKNEIVRFFPRDNLERNELSDGLMDEICNILKSQFKLLSEKQKLSLSLSSGLDSRVSLAASKELSQNILYYTWIKEDAVNEVETVKKLVSELGIKHKTFKFSKEPPQEFITVFKKNSSDMSHYQRITDAYNLYHMYPSDRLSIKSVASAITKQYYRNSYALLPNNINPKTISQLYGINTKTNFVRGMFREFISDARFNRVHKYNYDQYKMFYWEHRLGVWSSHWLSEWDLAQDVIDIYNNRCLLDIMLSCNKKKNKNDDILIDIINNIWPECLEIPINPQKNTSILKKPYRIYKGLKIRTLDQL